MAGDFHAVLTSEDRINGAPVSDHETRDFVDFLADMELAELRGTGASFSWTNKGEGNARIASRIGRGLVNQSWIDLFGDVEACLLAPSLSDHSPILIEAKQEQIGGRRPFRFLNVLASHHQFLEVFSECWRRNMTGNSIFQVWQKLKQVKVGLKQLNVRHLENVKQQVAAASASLSQIQQRLGDDISNSLLQAQEKEGIQKWKYWMDVEESVYKQKSRVDWLKLGNSNTHFFFAAMKQRKSRNRRSSLHNEAGVCLRDPDHCQLLEVSAGV